ncbi:hypothetical protein ACHQM5_024868 [Ranunculus cassubicifolius]
MLEMSKRRDEKLSQNSLFSTRIDIITLENFARRMQLEWEKFVKGQWNKEECVAEWEKCRACFLLQLHT